MMRFSCLKEQLDGVLRICAKATARQSTLPIAQNIMITAARGTLTCHATNLDVGVVLRFSGTVDVDGGIVVSPHLLQSFIAALDTGERIDAVLESPQTLVLQSGNRMARIKGFDVADFPIIPVKKDIARTAVFAAESFMEGMQRVIGSVAKTEARPELTGVAIVHKGDKEAVFVATDGFRLAESVIAVEEYFGDDVAPVIIPASAVDEILYVIAAGTTGKVMVSYGEGQVYIECGDVIIVSRVITGTYPDYRQIIPRDAATTVILDRNQCERAIRLADAFASKTTNDISVAVRPADGVCTYSGVLPRARRQRNIPYRRDYR